MKIASVLSVSALLALFSVVACSSPTPTASTADKSADTKGDDDDDATTPAKKSTTTTPATNTSTTTNNGTTTTTAGADACDTCMASKSPKFAAGLKCADACKDGDDACSTKCFSDSCGTAQNNECATAGTACATQCGPTQAEVNECNTCIAGLNAKAGAYDKCMFDTKCEAQACDDTCWSQSGCDKDEKACQAALNSTTCQAKCSGN